MINCAALALVQEAASTLTVLGSPAVFNNSFESESEEPSPSVASKDGTVVDGTRDPTGETTTPFSYAAGHQKQPQTPDFLQKQPNGLHKTTFLVPLLVQPTNKHSRVDKSTRPDNGHEDTNDNLNTVSPNDRTFGTSISNIFNQSASYNTRSMTQRRLTSNIPGFQSNLQHSSHASGSHVFSVPPPSLSDEAILHHMSPHNDQPNSVSYTIPMTPADQLLHTPLQPPEIQRPVRTKASSRSDNHSEGWLWPVVNCYMDALHSPLGPSISLSSQVPINNSPTFGRFPEAHPLFTPSHVNDPSEIDRKSVV